MARRILYLLIEEQDRELLSRALITAAAVDRGFDVVLMPQWIAWQNWGVLPPGLMLFKGNNTAQAVHMREAKRHGHTVASIEEEALGVSDRRQLLRCYDASVPEVCDAFLVHGRFQAGCLLDRHPALAGRVHVTGNPRIDLFRGAFAEDLWTEAARLRGRYGDFLLINTNFSTINPRGDDALGCFDACVRVGLVDPDDPDDLEDFFTWCAWETGNLAAIRAVLASLEECDFPWPVIVRPHPTENLDVWTEAFAGSKRVRVIRAGNHLAWTAAARLLVHTGCTTGLEALLLKTPALSLAIGDNPWHAMYLSNHVNPTSRRLEDAVETILTFAAGQDLITPERARCLARLQGHVLSGPDHRASLSVAEVLASLPSPGVGADDLARLARLRPVTSTDGKIDAATFAPGPVGETINGMRSVLGRVGRVTVTSPVPEVLVVTAPPERGGPE